jgi:hypothetical protein
MAQVVEQEALSSSHSKKRKAQDDWTRESHKVGFLYIYKMCSKPQNNKTTLKNYPTMGLHIAYYYLQNKFINILLLTFKLYIVW